MVNCYLVSFSDLLLRFVGHVVVFLLIIPTLLQSPTCTVTNLDVLMQFGHSDGSLVSVDRSNSRYSVSDHSLDLSL
jgi:hypothetical protein